MSQITSDWPADSSSANAEAASTTAGLIESFDFLLRTFDFGSSNNYLLPQLLRPVAVDSASFSGRGATFAVYKRRVSAFSVRDWTASSGDGLVVSVKFGEDHKIPSWVAYKNVMVEFTEQGQATPKTNHAAQSAMMEIFLSGHLPLRNHENIVRVLGLAWGSNPFDFARLSPVLVVEYAECGTLATLQKEQLLPLDTRRKLYLDVCKGLEALHSCGVLHGDVKPDNILVFPDATHKYLAKLSDFGFSRILHEQPETLLVGGTRPWKAPEASAPVSKRDAKYTDVYSCGLLVWSVFAHGAFSLGLVIEEPPHSKRNLDQVEELKASGEILSKVDLSCWYLKALEFAAARLAGVSQQDVVKPDASGQFNLTGVNSAIDIIERQILVLLCQNPRNSSMVEAVLKGLPGLVSSSKQYQNLQQVLQKSLATEPKARDLCQVIKLLGGNSEMRSHPLITSSPSDYSPLSWRPWLSMEPALASYLARMSVKSADTLYEQRKIRCGNAIFLAATFINGTGVEKNDQKAFHWLHYAWFADHEPVRAIFYRIMTGCGMKFQHPESLLNSLELIALKGSRVALESLKEISYNRYAKAKSMLRDHFAGVGATFFFQENMLHGFTYPSWVNTLSNIPILLENFSRLNSIAEYKANKRGDTILHVAACAGKPDAIAALIDRFDALHVDLVNDGGETSLLCACRAGQEGTALKLLHMGANATIASNSGETALHWLISFDDTETMRDVGDKLFERGADNLALVTEERRYSICENPSWGDSLPRGTALTWAVVRDRPDIVAFLLSKTTDPTSTIICKQSAGHDALEIASHLHNHKCLKTLVSLIERQGISQGQGHRANIIWSPAVIECLKGAVRFDMILRHGAKHLEAMEKSFDILLPKVANSTRVGGLVGYDHTLLFSAVTHSRDEVVQYLLTKATEAIKTAPDYEQGMQAGPDYGAYRVEHINRACGVEMRSPFLEAVRHNRIHIARLLLEHGADPQAKTRNAINGDSRAWNALHVLANTGHDVEGEALARMLVQECEVPINKQDGDVESEPPLLLALQNNSFRLADYLFSLGANINSTCQSSGFISFAEPTTTLGHAIATCARNSVHRIRYLLDRQEERQNIFIVEPGPRRRTALHRAAMGHLEMTSRATDVTDSAPVEWSDIDPDAARDIIIELLQVYSLPEHVDAREQRNGNTALHLAVLAGRPEVVELLLEYGADRAVLNDDNETALDLALRLQAGLIPATARNMNREKAARRECVDALGGAADS